MAYSTIRSELTHDKAPGDREVFEEFERPPSPHSSFRGPTKSHISGLLCVKQYQRENDVNTRMSRNGYVRVATALLVDCNLSRIKRRTLGEVDPLT